jgi:hypothetical protein
MSSKWVFFAFCFGMIYMEFWLLLTVILVLSRPPAQA